MQFHWLTEEEIVRVKEELVRIKSQCTNPEHQFLSARAQGDLGTARS